MNNSHENFHTPATPSSTLTLEIAGLGHVPSFKNKKRIGGLYRQSDGNWRGNPVLITRKDVKAWMDSATALLKSQLRSACPTIDGVTSTECCPPSLIAWFAQCESFDDAWQFISEECIKVQVVQSGLEGATITIERI